MYLRGLTLYIDQMAGPTSLIARIWPLAFFTRLSFLRKYLRNIANAMSSRRHHLAPKAAVSSPMKMPRMIRYMQKAILPELALGLYGVLGPDLHAINDRAGLALCRQMAAHHLVLMKLEEALRGRREKVKGGSSMQLSVAPSHLDRHCDNMR